MQDEQQRPERAQASATTSQEALHSTLTAANEPTQASVQDQAPGSEERKGLVATADAQVVDADDDPGKTAKMRVILPAKLPTHSRAAAAQRLSNLPLKAPRGVYYPVAHLLPLAPGWRTKRHIKRKGLRESNERFNEAERKGSRWGFMPLAIIFMAFLVVAASSITLYTALYNSTEQLYGSKVTTLPDILPKDNLKMYDDQGQMIYQMIDDGVQTSVPYSQLSPTLMHATIAIEDQYFWSNPGYDITGIVRAALDDITAHDTVSGASTITQQLIKNTILGQQRTAIRKLQEILLAPDVTRYYTKEQIITMYLNTIYYGDQAYGADAAAQIYFGLEDKPNLPAVKQLDLAQSAMLAGLPQNGDYYNPWLHKDRALNRMKDVLHNMNVQNYITHAQELQAIAEAEQEDFLKPMQVHNDLAVHYSAYTLRELMDKLHLKAGDLSRSGLTVMTALDLAKQNQVLKIAQKHIAENAKIHNMSNSAVVVMNPHDGSLLTLVGNINPNDPKSGAFDVASQGLRQPGSSFKPFIYATAFNKGVSPGDHVQDGPLTINMCCGLPAYQPTNYDMKYHGNITYRYALQNSFNIPAVKLLMQTGVDPALQMALNLGITTYAGVPNYTMVLGSLSVHLTDMVSAYSTFANSGKHVTPHAITEVRDSQGKVVYRPDMNAKRVISPQLAYLMANVLSDNNSRTFEFGKCSVLYLYSTSQSQCYAGNPGPIRPAAVKTGTSNDFRDNWTVGWTTDYTVGVWSGNNDNSPMFNVTGVDGAAPIWHDTMQLFEQGHAIRNFTNPGGLARRGNDWYIPQGKH
ncbi:hypothetical protein KSC_079370 [Ktedonobacter sp. SOSP1-52]|uniref:transglycosylase domain-containing protein n=1 Tax=Ktedonobacter sp. SOSP1-52 TaxID=2778366 RepID=UPI0019157E76|nr:transglycosylase domain-containing protein [Ktedonobacter sp. SOSP1-52]GHO69045.1 hypothetical protein KSC_079370 [Ktedonobacter sp. SOSP1-52]